MDAASEVASAAHYFLPPCRWLRRGEHVPPAYPFGARLRREPPLHLEYQVHCLSRCRVEGLGVRPGSGFSSRRFQIRARKVPRLTGPVALAVFSIRT